MTQPASTFDPQYLKQTMSRWQRTALMLLLLITGLAALAEWLIFAVSAIAFFKAFDVAGQNDIANASLRSGLAALFLGWAGLVLTLALRQLLWPTTEKAYVRAVVAITAMPWSVAGAFGLFVYMSSDFTGYLIFFGFWAGISALSLLIGASVFRREKKAQDRQIAGEWQEAMVEARVNRSPNGEKALSSEVEKSIRDLTDTSSAYHRRDAARALSKLPESDSRVIVALMMAEYSDAHADVRTEAKLALNAPVYHAYLLQNSEWASKMTRLVQARIGQQS